MRHLHRPLALALILLIVSPGATSRAAAAPDTDPRLARVEQWLNAVLHHEPGVDDAAAAMVGAWTNSDLRVLWVDLNVIVQLMRNPRGLAFQVRVEGQKAPERVRYTTAQMHRMKVLACAAAGMVTLPVCIDQRAGAEIDNDLARLSSLAAAARLGGDHDNYILRRGALLHTDIGLLGRASDEGIVGGASAVSQGVRLDIADGRGMGFAQSTVQWEIARTLLDVVIPAGEDRPAPSRDGMVRLWYHAIAAWRQQREQHDTRHLDLARQLFPNDADILFLSGCQHETYAGPQIYNAVRSVVLPTGFKLDVESERGELRLAEGFFRRALAARPDFSEAHLRLGRVLLLRGRAPEAAIELQQAIASPDDNDDERLLYYAELFAGAAAEAMSQFDAARASYEKAFGRYPAAQSPRLALSALARRRGDRVAALRALQEVFELRPSVDPALDEPWWWYDVAPARNTDALLEELRKPFLKTTE